MEFTDHSNHKVIDLDCEKCNPRIGYKDILGHWRYFSEEKIEGQPSPSKFVPISNIEKTNINYLQEENSDLKEQLKRAKGLRWKAEARILDMQDDCRKMLNMLKECFQFLCGTWSDEAEENHLNNIQEMIEKVESSKKYG